MFPSWREKTSGPPRRHFGKVTNSHSWWGMLNHVLTKCNSYQHLLWTSQLKSQNFVCFPVYGVSGFWYFFVLPKVGVLGTGASYDISLVLSCYNCCSNVPFSVTHNVSDERERERERERRHRKHLLTTVWNKTFHVGLHSPRGLPFALSESPWLLLHPRHIQKES